MEHFLNHLRTEIKIQIAQYKIDRQAYSLIHEGRGDDTTLIIEEALFNSRRTVTANQWRDYRQNRITAAQLLGDEPLTQESSQ